MSKIPVLMYHNVAPVTDDDQSCLNLAGMTISIDRFQDHMSYIAEHYTAVRMSDMVSWQIGESSLAPNACVITFDDGLLDVYNYAFPVMQNLGLTATFFVIGQSLVSDQPSWLHAMYEVLDGYPTEECGSAFAAAIEEYPRHRQFDKPALRSWIKEHLNYMDRVARDELLISIRSQLGEGQTIGIPFMSSGHMADLVDSGFEIGCHSMRHENLSILSDDELAEDTHDSRAVIAEAIGHNPEAYCYPFGGATSYNERVINMVKQHGFTSASTSSFGFNDRMTNRFEIRRIPMANAGASDLAQKLTGRRPLSARAKAVPRRIGRAARRILSR